MKIIFLLWILVLLISCDLGNKKSQNVNQPTEFENDVNAIFSKDTLKENDIIKVNPYHNGRLTENFEPNQKDFSKEFFELRTRDSNNFLDSLYRFNCSNIWLDQNENDGILGLDYKYLTMKFNNIVKKDSVTYFIQGKSKVGKNICDFEGEIILKYAHKSKHTDLPNITQGSLAGIYELRENAKQKYSGIFKGTFESFFLIDSLNNIHKDQLFEYADIYYNNSFVGTWEGYKDKNIKKCIWGDERLPFTFDYDIGDGEMIINEKYLKNKN